MIQNLEFQYELTAEYSDPVWDHSFSFLFLPTDTSQQKITELEAVIPDCPNCCSSIDSFGNHRLYGRIEQPHTGFQIRISGTAQTGLNVFEEYTADPFDALPLKAQTALTIPGDRIERLHAELGLNQFAGTYEKVLRIMQGLHDSFDYLPGSTTVHEPAEAALRLGHGVCQDYAHIMLSLLRMEGIPARYVTGMMLGEGASHAWVEALCRGYWYGFDPTNSRLVDDSYIRVSCGRDSGDCSIIRGTFRGLANQTQTETVIVRQR